MKFIHLLKMDKFKTEYLCFSSLLNYSFSPHESTINVRNILSGKFEKSALRLPHLKFIQIEVRCKLPQKKLSFEAS